MTQPSVSEGIASLCGIPCFVVTREPVADEGHVLRVVGRLDQAVQAGDNEVAEALALSPAFGGFCGWLETEARARLNLILKVPEHVDLDAVHDCVDVLRRGVWFAVTDPDAAAGLAADGEIAEVPRLLKKAPAQAKGRLVPRMEVAWKTYGRSHEVPDGTALPLVDIADPAAGLPREWHVYVDGKFQFTGTDPSNTISRSQVHELIAAGAQAGVPTAAATLQLLDDLDAIEPGVWIPSAPEHVSASSSEVHVTLRLWPKVKQWHLDLIEGPDGSYTLAAITLSGPTGDTVAALDQDAVATHAKVRAAVARKAKDLYAQFRAEADLALMDYPARARDAGQLSPYFAAANRLLHPLKQGSIDVADVPDDVKAIVGSLVTAAEEEAFESTQTPDDLVAKINNDLSSHLWPLIQLLFPTSSQPVPS